MRKKLADARVQCGFVLLACLFAQLVMHMNCDTIFQDDYIFLSALDGGKTLCAFIAERWNTWSSRFLIESLLVYTTRSLRVWRVLDSLVMVLMTWSLARLANVEKRPGMLAVSGLLTLSIPFQILRSTGWEATALNYYWPLACGLLAAVPLSDALWGRRTPKALCALAIPAALLAANAEQMAAGLFGAYTVLGGALVWKEKRVRPMLAAVWGIAVAELVLILLCPGNAVRAQQAIALVNLRDYGQFSLIDRLSIGLTSTLALMFFTFNPILRLFGVTGVAANASQRRGVLAVLIAALPLLFMEALPVLKEVGPFAGTVRQFGTYVLQLGPEGIAQPLRMPLLFAAVCFLGLMAVTMAQALGRRPMALICVFLYALGFASRMAVSLSPTVVESGERTMLPLYGMLMLCMLLLLRECRAEGRRRWLVWAAMAILAVTAAGTVLSSFALAR